MSLRHIFLTILGTTTLFSCVSKKQYQTVEQQKDSLFRITQQLQTEHQYYKDSTIQVIHSVNLAMDKQRLRASALNDSLQICQQQFQENQIYLESLGENMNDKQRKLATEIVAKNKAIASKELELNDALAEAEKERKRLQKIREELQSVSQRVKELESELRRKDSAVILLREAIMKALAGFDELDIQVEFKNGKVYVILPEKLLFKSGSTSVDPKGVEALILISKALNEKSDVQIGVEGHTDNIPLKESERMKDNLDLSVLRATSISRILIQQGGVAENRIAAIGRGATMPVAKNDTPEGRAKNRRTEIILTPQLDKILEILNSK
jgi:chemotaxis protein MotB